MTSKLEVRDVSFSYDQSRQILKDINLHLADGELISLLGVSGGGKTTLFNIIAGLYRPDTGKVLLDGKEITGQPGRVSYMLQKDMLLPYRTVEDNIALPMLIKGMDKKQARSIVSSHLADFGLEGTQKKYPAELSGGMRQRAALLRTYLFSADVALLDEPFSALDTFTKSEMHRWYLDVMSRIKLSTIFITHDVDEAILLSDRIYLLGGSPGSINGEIVISEPKPRRKDFTLSETFLEYKREIVSRINEIPRQ